MSDLVKIYLLAPHLIDSESASYVPGSTRKIERTNLKVYRLLLAGEMLIYATSRSAGHLYEISQATSRTAAKPAAFQLSKVVLSVLQNRVRLIGPLVQNSVCVCEQNTSHTNRYRK